LQYRQILTEQFPVKQRSFGRRPRRQQQQQPQPVAVHVISLGCAKNLVDTEVMCGSAVTSGLVLTAQREHADIILINTCSFVADARDEAFCEIQQALVWKQQGSRRYVVVSGCLPQRDLPALRQQLRDVDMFLGLDDVPHAGTRLLELVNGNAAPAPEVFAESTFLYDETLPRLQLTPRQYAYVKIAEGCNHRCRFCAIPLIRGRQRSRSIDSVQRECRQLLDQGVAELNLISQDTTAYGSDRDDAATLAKLLRTVDALPGMFWLRLLYTHPAHFTDELIDVFASSSHLLPYVDMPLQHINDAVLKGMGRGIGAAATRALLDRLRARIPQLTLRTTFLVGYPGETDAAFAELESFVEQFQFDRLGVFAFSPEENTPAAALTANLVPAAVAEQRRARLLELQQQISLRRNQALLGQRIDVLLEGQDEHGRMLGRSRGDAPEVDNQVTIEAPRVMPTKLIVPVVITAAGPYDLIGKLA